MRIAGSSFCDSVVPCQAAAASCRTPVPAGRRCHTGRRCGTQRRGMILLVVLVIISLLALISAMFAYRMDGERMGAEALRDLQQARLAAESGMERIKLLLRDDRTNMDTWYSNPDAFRRVPVWMPDERDFIGGTESVTRKDAVPGQPAWRYSVVSYERINEEQVYLRYGLTDEASKLNINFASRGELLRLVSTLDLGDIPPDALVDCLIDWRDADSELTSPLGAETPYYMTLNPSYRAKNRPFDSIDELLMVRHWTGQFIWGEDHNRNGYLDENEDDGVDGAFPPDNGDGNLERGLAPFITVHSWDWNFANDNKPRSDINAMNWGDPEQLPEHLLEEMSPELIEFLAEAKQRGFKFRSVGELWGLEVYEDGSSNYDEAWEAYRAQVQEENAVPKEDEQEDDEEEEEEDEDFEDPDDWADEGDEDENRDPDDERRPDEGTDENVDDELDDDLAERKERVRYQAVNDEPPAGGRGRRPGGRDDRPGAENDAPGAGQSDGRAPGGRRGRDRGRGGAAGQTDEDQRDGRGRPGDNGRDGAGTRPDEEEDEAAREARRGTPIVSPVTAEQMEIAMDRLATVTSPVRVGQINVNTAPVEVLMSIIGMTAEEADAIATRRRSMEGPDKMTPAWMVSSGALSPEKFAVLSNKFTSRSIQFTADVIGFADHVGTFRRLQAVIEMRGHMTQIRYYRDISSLGIGFPVRDDERSEGFAFRNE